jgi:hypothetical protein
MGLLEFNIIRKHNWTQITVLSGQRKQLQNIYRHVVRQFGAAKCISLFVQVGSIS